MCQTQKIIFIFLFSAIILLIPLLASKFSSEVNWSLTDFFVAAISIMIAGFGYEMLTAKNSNFFYRLAVAITVLTNLILLWVNFAVGIIGNESNQFNLIYSLIPIFEVIFLLLYCSQPQKLSKVQKIASLFPLIIFSLAFFHGLLETYSPVYQFKILLFHLFFTLILFLSAFFFNFSTRSKKL